jgi:hypothetical protein
MMTRKIPTARFGGNPLQATPIATPGGGIQGREACRLHAEEAGDGDD